MVPFITKLAKQSISAARLLVMVFAILAQALEKAGKPITGTNLLEQRRAAGTFELVGGKMTFQPNGTVAMPVQIQEIDGTGAGKRIK